MSGIETVAHAFGFVVDDDRLAYDPLAHLWSEPVLPIAERETYDPVPATGCPGACRYGECPAPGSYMGCGGCCGCLRGCQMVWEQQQVAPILWTGDLA